VWAVFILVSFVLLDNPHLIVDMFSDYGGGTVLFANTIYHYVPPIMMLFFVVLVRKDHEQMLWLSRWGLCAQVLWQVALSHLPVLIYATIFNFPEVYGFDDLRWWHILLIYETSCVFIWTVGLLLVLSSANSWRGEGGVLDPLHVEQALNRLRRTKPGKVVM